MKIATWNVNSINMRIPLLLKWLEKYKPDVVLLQETKCLNEKFPTREIEELGYNIVLSGQKTFNGVAILSLHPIDEFHTKFLDNPKAHEARYIEAIISLKEAKTSLRVISIYVPNGTDLESDRYQIKLQFMDALYGHLQTLKQLDECIIIGGDYNVAAEDIDTYDPSTLEKTVLFDLAIRKKFRSLLNLGYIDAFRAINPNQPQFSWWDYRGGAWQKNQGVRIDYLLLSPEAADCLDKAYIDTQQRGEEKPSDHVPVICELNI